MIPTATSGALLSVWMTTRRPLARENRCAGQGFGRGASGAAAAGGGALGAVFLAARVVEAQPVLHPAVSPAVKARVTQVEYTVFLWYLTITSAIPAGEGSILGYTVKTPLSLATAAFEQKLRL
jgi:hypothetical protein